jgi:hypothetical protein
VRRVTRRLKPGSPDADTEGVAPLQVETRAAVRARARRSDAGVLVIGTLAKLMIFLAVIGTAGYDSISLASTHITVQDDAQEAAQVGHDVLVRHGTPQMAYAAVLDYCEKHQDTLVPDSFVVGKDHAVTLTLTREAHTIVSSHLPRVKNYVVATATAIAKDPLT